MQCDTSFSIMCLTSEMNFCAESEKTVNHNVAIRYYWCGVTGSDTHIDTVHVMF